jgi:hypothetical protein
VAAEFEDRVGVGGRGPEPLGSGHVVAASITASMAVTNRYFT